MKDSDEEIGRLILLMGDERILFVTGENELAELGRNTLESLGYRVAVSGDYEKTLRADRTGLEACHLVVADFSGPKKNGRPAFVTNFKALNPTTPLVAVIGRMDDDFEEIKRDIRVADVVGKPFTVGELSAVVRKVLDRTARTEAFAPKGDSR